MIWTIQSAHSADMTITTVKAGAPMDFKQRVALVCAAIPAGKVASYGQVARLCGCPRRARQVGQALGCGVSDVAYRVVNCRGYLSGADAFLVPGLQKRLLESEGVAVSEERIVDLKCYGWEISGTELAALDAAFSKLGI